jgi:hypothetical protein
MRIKIHIMLKILNFFERGSYNIININTKKSFKKNVKMHTSLIKSRDQKIIIENILMKFFIGTKKIKIFIGTKSLYLT